jgi:Cytochrome c7 and related cytochrome c
MTRIRPAIAVVAAALLQVAVLIQAAQDTPPAGEFRPPPPPEQPIAFSHRTHITQGLTCTACHSGAETADRATLPATATCMGCHARVKTESPEIQKLAGFDSKREEVPWRRVYRLPDYVPFSHRVHVSAGKTSCESCHGNVREMTVMQKVRDTSMATCMQCHTERSAPVQCNACHEPR